MFYYSCQIILPSLLCFILIFCDPLTADAASTKRWYWPFESHAAARQLERQADTGGLIVTKPPVDIEVQDCCEKKSLLDTWSARPGIIRGVMRPHIAHLERDYRECLLVAKTKKRLFLESIERPSQTEGLDLESSQPNNALLERGE